MEQLSIDVLLEFLYNKFAITFWFCLFGSFSKEYLAYLTISKTGSNSKKYGNFNLGKVVMSAVFSTILMCACADYVKVELHIEVYAIISVILGMWGLGIMKIIIDKKFLYVLSNKITKYITDPIIKSAVESASESLEEDNKESNKKQQSKDETENKNEKTDELGS